MEEGEAGGDRERSVLSLRSSAHARRGFHDVVSHSKGNSPVSFTDEGRRRSGLRLKHNS